MTSNRSYGRRARIALHLRNGVDRAAMVTFGAFCCSGAQYVAVPFNCAEVYREQRLRAAARRGIRTLEYYVATAALPEHRPPQR